MTLFPFFKKKDFFTAAEKAFILTAIRNCEQQTSGEIRVYVESRNPLVSTVDRAAAIFTKLEMHKTADRNGVLLYIATKDREVALFGDEGIYKATGAEYWDNAVKSMLAQFTGDDIVKGLVHSIFQVGQTLKEKFPYNATEDKNELPDDIVFGR